MADARKYVIVKRGKGRKGKYTFHRSVGQTDGRRISKQMNEQGRWETKCVLRSTLASYI